ncbi:Geranylgeranyl pyrophosphate synthase-like protein [Desulfitobacterium hafniense]|uniref:Geranylgeranyl pyrophosphate synthase-like protein n=1 Tax=Desulfitobacterium hafniense TaxID=49338 RepID=A0A098AVL4_DESHA|nr:polyprenyl synthetase family protein [Desulfitobacterium hafniense]CDX00137.1 Geranylgeranyl pyrophosphate synthase-like protein [Desulfitobacterium hafniense]
MNLQLDQIFFREIDIVLAKARLDAEMERLIRVSLNADSPTGELFRWAHLTRMSCECVGGELEAVLPGAIGMEFFALALDIFDDVQDQDNENMPWRQLPDAQAINLAICLLMLSEESISTIPNNRMFKEVSTILHRTGICASNGQFQEFLYDGRQQVSFEQYFEMAGQKAGSLTACACQIGAALGGAEETVVHALEQFGLNLGILNQIRNDLNDFMDFFRKNDFINSKKTLPYVYLLNTLKGEAAERFKELTQRCVKGEQGFGEKEREYVRQLAAEEGVALYCTVMFEIYCQKAREILEGIPVPEKHKENMKELVRESV